jgi:hypothetical protein
MEEESPDATDPGGDQAGSDEEKEKKFFRWWNVIEEAETRGSLVGYSMKGKARRNSSRTVSFDWVFQPSTETPATQSPQFHWLDLNWAFRFQKSPFDTGIPHPPAWSIFLDLFPPYDKIFQVSGNISLVDGASTLGLWKFEETFQPASRDQDICTWCSHRRNLDSYVHPWFGYLESLFRVQKVLY